MSSSAMCGKILKQQAILSLPCSVSQSLVALYSPRGTSSIPLRDCAAGVGCTPTGNASCTRFFSQASSSAGPSASASTRVSGLAASFAAFSLASVSWYSAAPPAACAQQPSPSPSPSTSDSNSDPLMALLQDVSTPEKESSSHPSAVHFSNNPHSQPLHHSGATQGDSLQRSPVGPQIEVASPWGTSPAWDRIVQRRFLAENRLRAYLQIKQRDVQTWLDHMQAFGRLSREEFEVEMRRVEDEVNQTTNAILYGIQDPNARRNFLQQYGCTKWSPEAIQAIKQYSPLVEVGAGLGHWQAALLAHKVDILAFDDWSQLPIHDVRVSEPTFAPGSKVERGDEKQVAGHPRRSLLLVYPGPDNMAVQALKQYKGKYLLYVGEPRQGVNATPEFFDLLQKEWEVLEVVEVEPFPEGYEQLWVLKRTSAVKKGWLW